MNTPILSIIVPVYNASTTLDACIESVLLQDYSDYELILIDDGSNDGSDKKCHAAAKKDNRIKAIVKGNEGVSATRNRGIDAAVGDYIVFLDSDDTLLPGALSALMEASDEDLIVGGLVHVIPACPSGFLNVPSKGTFSIKDVSAIEQLLCEIFVTAPWSKRFKRSIINKYGLRFNNRMFYGEDTDFVYRYIAVIERIATIEWAVTRYNDCTCARHKKYKVTFDTFKLLTDRINENINTLEEVSGSQLPVTRNFNLEYATDVYFESLVHYTDYTTFYKEIVLIRRDSPRFKVTTRKKRIVKWLILHNIFATYIVFQIYAKIRR